MIMTTNTLIPTSLFFLPLMLIVPNVRAIPSMDHKQRRGNSTLYTRAAPSSNDTPGSSLSVQIWAPLLGIAGVILAMVLISCVKRRRLSAAILAAQQANNGASSGTVNANSTTTGAPRRSRRQRRTPSQISTRSLPAYMEDPGDMEVVLGRGQPSTGDRMDDMEEEVPEVSEPVEQHDITDSRTPLLTSPPVLPIPIVEPPARTSHSFDSMRIGSETSRDALLRHTLSIEELRSLGDAPPYESPTEMVELRIEAMRSPSILRTSQVQLADIPTTQSNSDPNTSTSSSESPTTTAVPRSGFRRIISRLMPTPSTSSPTLPSAATNLIPNPGSSSQFVPAPQTHTRAGSTTTIASITPPARSRSRQSTHARSRSQSTTTQLRSRASAHSLSLASFSRSSISLSLSSSNTTSDSVHPGMPNPTSNLSTSSISAPLSHTLVRTNFVYPSSGPTSEQMRFISSLETVGKYGMPYGEAATAARSQELLLAQMAPPPPFNFESSAGVSTNGTRRSGEADGDQQAERNYDNGGETVETTTRVNEGEDIATQLESEMPQPTPSSPETTSLESISPASTTPSNTSQPTSSTKSSRPQTSSSMQTVRPHTAGSTQTVRPSSAQLNPV